MYYKAGMCKDGRRMRMAYYWGSYIEVLTAKVDVKGNVELSWNSLIIQPEPVGNDCYDRMSQLTPEGRRKFEARELFISALWERLVTGETTSAIMYD